MTSGRITPARIWVAPLIEARFAFQRLQQVECAPGHGDGPKALGDDQCQSDVLVAGDGDADVVAEKRNQVFVNDAADDDAGDADLRRFSQGRPGDVRAADNDLAGQGRRDLCLGQIALRRRGDHLNLPHPLAADAEDALNQSAFGLDNDALAGHRFGDVARQIGSQVDRQRRLADADIAGNGADGLDRAR